jgi:subtilase family serine protease
MLNMKKLTAVALAVGVLTASCSGGGAGSPVPQIGSGEPSAQGTHATRSASAVAVAPAGWGLTSTQPFQLSNAGDQGGLSATQSVTVRLGLQLHNVDGLKSLVQSGQTISPAAFAATYAPSGSDVQQVATYMQAQGFTAITVEPNNLIVSATGNAAQVEKAFDTTLHSFSQNGANVYANTTAAYVPASLSGIVVAVLGLNDAQTFKATPHRGNATAAPTPQPTPTAEPESPCDLSSLSLIGLPSPEPEPSAVSGNVGCLRNYTPADFWRAYDVGSVPAATHVNVAVMAEGNVAQSLSDLRVNEQADGLVAVPVVVKSVGVASSDTSGDDEWTLDMTASSGMARAVRTIYLYDTTSLTDSDIALEYNHWVTDDLAPIGNSSFGGCEYGPYLDGSMVLDDEILLQGAAQGQTMFASSGDTGSFCSVGTPNGVPAGVPLVEYPAASPYVVGVGGTTLASQTDGSYQGEVPWYSGGGGVSQFEYSPSWQNGIQPASSTPVGFTFRGVPDVAMDADLQTGMTIYITGYGWTTIGGTSLASPLAAGVWARMLQVHASLGYAAPRLYHVYAVSTPSSQTTVPPPTRMYGGFHDILAGGNGLYTALPGYDYTTGLGSFDVSATSAIIGQ